MEGLGEVQQGDELAGCRVEAYLGREARFDAYAARQLAVDRAVLVQVGAPDLESDQQEVVRTEAVTLAGIEHPNLVAVLDAGSLGTRAFRVLDRISGESLATLISGPGMDSDASLRLADEIAGALDALHGAGLLHRDLCPDAIIVGSEGRGFLRPPAVPPSRQGEVTLSASHPPALAYVAPEVIRGSPPDPAADRCSFAAVLFELLTGEPPFTSAEAAIEHSRGGVAPSARRVRPELALDVDEALRAGLAREPEDRPANAVELVAQVRRGLRGTLPPPRREPTTQEQVVSPRRRAIPVVIAALGAVVVAALVVVLIVGGDDESTSEPPGFGSSLGVDAAEVETVDCRGRPPSRRSPACTVMQVDLPGRSLVATEDGSIRGWTVQGAKGELKLQVLRPRDGGYFQVFVGQVEEPPDTGTHHFDSNLQIEAGDRVAIYVESGAGIGVRRVETGVTTNRWLPPRGGGEPTAAEMSKGTGFDHELLVGLDYRPGVPIDEPELLNGAQAAAATDGELLRSRKMPLSDDLTATVKLVEADGTIWIDLFDGDRRISRIEMPDAVPGGEIDYFAAVPYGDGDGEVGLGWVNQGEDRAVEHFFQIRQRFFDFIS